MHESTHTVLSDPSAQVYKGATVIELATKSDTAFRNAEFRVLIWLDNVVDSATGVGADDRDALAFGRILNAMKELVLSATVTLATASRDAGTLSTTATLFKKDA